MGNEVDELREKVTKIVHFAYCDGFQNAMDVGCRGEYFGWAGSETRKRLKELLGDDYIEPEL